MQDADEITQPGGPVLLEGSAEARMVAELAVMVKFYGAQLEQVASELRRAPLTVEMRSALWHRMVALRDDFSRAMFPLAPWNAPRAGEER